MYEVRCYQAPYSDYPQYVISHIDWRKYSDRWKEQYHYATAKHPSGFNDKLKNKIRARDGFKCRNCGATNDGIRGDIDYPSAKIKNEMVGLNATQMKDYYNKNFRHSREHKRDLDVHHIDYDKNNLSEDNLITLCEKCHGKTKALKREYWKKYYEDMMGGVIDGKNK